MIRVKIFDDYDCENDVEKFLKENGILRDQIISINMAIDSEANRRLSRRSTKQIMLVWEDNK